MAKSALPFLIEPAELRYWIDEPQVLIVDLCAQEIYRDHHLPGAVHLPYAAITQTCPPVKGLLPEPAALSEVLASIGLTPEHHVVAYDEEGGGKAARLLWTLEVTGHRHASLLNGGLTAWMDAGQPINNHAAMVPPGRFQAANRPEPVADQAYIRARLGNPDVVLVDARSAAEFSGTNRRAERAGHIPGAVNIEWTRALDEQRSQRLRPPQTLRALYEEAGVTPDKEVITYCHSHHRSAHTYFVLKLLGYPRVRGYPGSWSDWGNTADTPVE